MTLSPELRTAWSPACRRPRSSLLHGVSTEVGVAAEVVVGVAADERGAAPKQRQHLLNEIDLCIVEETL